jgi:hypothetical protein
MTPRRAIAGKTAPASSRMPDHKLTVTNGEAMSEGGSSEPRAAAMVSAKPRGPKRLPARQS